MTDLTLSGEQVGMTLLLGPLGAIIGGVLGDEWAVLAGGILGGAVGIFLGPTLVKEGTSLVESLR